MLIMHILEVQGPVGSQLLVGGPSGWLLQPFGHPLDMFISIAKRYSINHPAQRFPTHPSIHPYPLIAQKQ